MSKSQKFVDARLTYLSPACTSSHVYYTRSNTVDTAHYSARSVQIRNARLAIQSPSLESTGFSLLRNRTTVSDFSSRDAMPAYADELSGVLRELTGADTAIMFGWYFRDTATPSSSFEFNRQTEEVHTDYAFDHADYMLRSMLLRVGCKDRVPRRVALFNVWRPVSEPPQDLPLALCDCRTVEPGDSVRSERIGVDEIPGPSQLVRDSPPDPRRPAWQRFRFSARHRWYYFPDMTRDEALIFRCYDSESGSTRSVPHAAFRDPTVASGISRRSLDVRVAAYYF